MKMNELDTIVVEWRDGGPDEREEVWKGLVEHFSFPLKSKANQLIRSYDKGDIDSMDLVQETLLRGWNKKSTFHGDSLNQFGSWLFTIMQNCFLDHCRRPNKEQLLTTWFGFHDEEASTASRKVLDKEKEAALMAAIATLPPSHQEVVCLRHLEGLKFREISEKTEGTINTVVGRYRRALASLKILIEKLD